MSCDGPRSARKESDDDSRADAVDCLRLDAAQFKTAANTAAGTLAMWAWLVAALALASQSLLPSGMFAPLLTLGADDRGGLSATGSLFALGLAVMSWRSTKSDSGLRRTLRGAGVNIKRVARTVKEIERKTFHITGLFVPLLFNLALEHGEGVGMSADRNERKLACWAPVHPRGE